MASKKKKQFASADDLERLEKRIDEIGRALNINADCIATNARLLDKATAVVVKLHPEGLAGVEPVWEECSAAFVVCDFLRRAGKDEK